MDNPESGTSMWIGSQARPDGTYGAALHIGNDVSWTISPEQAIRYAAGLVKRSVQAEHDAAVMRSLRSVGLPIEQAGLVLVDVRADRKEDHTATYPLEVVPSVSAFTGEPFLAVSHPQLRDRWQWSPTEARDHAVGVLEAVAAATEDTRLHRVLTSPRFALGDASARAAIGTLGEHWPEPRS